MAQLVEALRYKVAGSIPECVIGIFHWHNPFGRTMALGLTQLLTEMSVRNISWGWRWPVLRADNLTTFMFRLSWNLGASDSWNPQGLSRPVMGLLYLLYIIHNLNVSVAISTIINLPSPEYWWNTTNCHIVWACTYITMLCLLQNV